MALAPRVRLVRRPGPFAVPGASSSGFASTSFFRSCAGCVAGGLVSDGGSLRSGCRHHYLSASGIQPTIPPSSGNPALGSSGVGLLLRLTASFRAPGTAALGRMAVEEREFIANADLLALIRLSSSGSVTTSLLRHPPHRSRSRFDHGSRGHSDRQSGGGCCRRRRIDARSVAHSPYLKQEAGPGS